MGRVVLYSPEGGSLGAVLALQARAEAAQIEVGACAAGKPWNEVRAELQPGDTLVVDSLSFFASLNELLGFVAISGVRVRSLDEAWFSEGPIVDLLDYQRKLYELGSSLHAQRTKQGLLHAARKGRKPGRRPGKGRGL